MLVILRAERLPTLVLACGIGAVGYTITSFRARFSLSAAVGFFLALGACPVAMVAGFVVVLVRTALELR